MLGLFVKTGGILSAPLTGGNGFIICLHRVLPTAQHRPYSGKNGMAVSPQYLEWLITSIRQLGFTIISIDEVCDGLKKGNLKNKFAAITLDDGFKDNLEYGYPVFKKHNCPFTIYVTNCMPNGTLKLWAEGLEDVVHSSNKIEFEWAGVKHIYTTNTRAEKISAYNQLRFFVLDAHNLTEFNNRINAVLGNTPWKNEPQYQDTAALSLTWNEIRQLGGEPLCTIGAHTLNHLPLAKLTEADALHEIKGSCAELSEKTGKNIVHFAYPYGSANECSYREFALAEKAGCVSSVTGRPANISSGYVNHMQAIARYAIGEGTDMQRLKQISNGILHYSFNGFNKIKTN